MKRRHIKHKSNKHGLFWALFIIAFIIVINLIFFLIPFSYERYSLYTDKATVQYNVQESYQETVNQNNCNEASGCVCTAHGGFLWLTCVQCSCTRERTVIKEKIVSVLKETTVKDSATLFETLTGSRVSQMEAQQTAQILLDFLSQKGTGYGSITNVYKQGSYWIVEASYSGNIFISADNGKIEYVGNMQNPTSFDSFLQSINSQ